MKPRAFLALLLPGYAFLYLPIAFMVVFGFNDSRLVTSWSGFSLRWYVSLWHNELLVEAALLSLRIAALSATCATILGTMAGYALARAGRFRGRAALAAGIAVPLVIPEVVFGLALLLLLVASQTLLGIPAERGAATIAIAHTTFALAYVAVLVRARLADGGTELEEAAADLGARPLVVFARVSLPLMTPALVSGWLLAFTLSLDDLVLASFTGGPGATTLPMALFSAAKLGITPEFYALATLILALILLALAGAWLFRRFAVAPLAPVE